MTVEEDDSPRTSALDIDFQASLRPSVAHPLQNSSSSAGALLSPPSTSSSLPLSSSAAVGISAVTPPPLAQQSNRSRITQPSDETIRLATQLVGERGFAISRYGLTAPTSVRDRLVVGAAPSPTNRPSISSASSSFFRVLPAPPVPRPPHTWKPPEGGGFARPSLNNRPRKRSSDQGNIDTSSAFRTPAKKPRRDLPGNLDLGDFVPPQTPEDFPLPDGISPLFFSSSSSTKSMTGRPPSFSNSEPAAAMLSRLRDDQGTVKTVKLPKGHVSSASPARAYSTMGTPGSGVSVDSRSSRSPDIRHLPLEQRDLAGIGVLELLDQDERPTFIIDLADGANFSTGPLKLVFENASLVASTGLHELISQNPDRSSDLSRFKAWILRFVKDHRSLRSADLALPSLSYGGINWTCSTLRSRYRVVSGNSAAVSITPTSPAAPAREKSVLEQHSPGSTPSRDSHTPGRDRAPSDLDYFGYVDPDPSLNAARRADSEPRNTLAGTGDLRPDTPMIRTEDEVDIHDPDTDLVLPSFDWTRIPDTSGMTPHLQFARSKSWDMTPLGPIECWPEALRVMSNMIMGSPHAAAMYWGPEYTAIYNESYLDLAGNKHPKLMGMSYTEAWAEIWDEIKPVFDAAWNHGQATMKHDDRLFISRNGYLEETFFSWSLVPLVGGDGSVVALYNPAFENTRRKVNERRMHTLREIGERTSLARDVKGFWKQVRKGLEFNEFDIPFALIYSVAEDSESENNSMHSGSVFNPPQIYLEGSLGVPTDHPCAIQSINLKTSDEGFAPWMRWSMAQPSVPIVMSKDDGTLPQGLIEGIQWRGFGDPSRTIVVFPVHPTTGGESVVGFIIMGINPRRSYNDDYQLFVNLLSRQLATSMASVVLFEEEIKRGQQAARIAAMDRQQLSLQLRLRTQEAVESEYKFTRMAEFAPVGIFIANAQGEINFSNDSWWEISRHPRTVNSTNTWRESVLAEDRPAVDAEWRRLIHDKVSIVQEFRFKASREVDGHPIETWALMSAYPEKDSNGETKAIFGCITDISKQKWAEAFQKQRREEALELKRQQENFIDMTSHEMRNPLSALCQCADEISSRIVQYREGEAEMTERLRNTLEGCLEAANTISLCANHQKRIVDDVLTLSRLDSRMVEVTPTVTKPVEILETSFKMFDAEFTSNNIRAQFIIDQSYRDMGIDTAKIDPARLQQVLINLLTNAIKFTQKREERSIVVTLGASQDVSQAQVGGIEFFQGGPEAKEDITDKPDWGEGEKFNLHISVSDTGPGLTDEERAMLFQRFRQASPRTHVEYGGSGLGLFISRMLTELQGGQIGVLSQKGHGSTFAFYIKSRKCIDVHPHPASPSIYKNGTDMLSIAPVIDPATVDVLVVEDNEVNQKVLGRLLRRIGFKAHLANHGGEAIEKLQKSRHWNHHVAAAKGHDPVVLGEGEEMINISIILMDLEMPVMDGTTCARKIRELEEQGMLTTRVPIIAVTAYVRPEQIGYAKESGMDDIVSKPFRANDLTPKITSLLLDPPTGNGSIPPSPMSITTPGSEMATLDMKPPN